MKFINCEYTQFVKNIQNKKIILFGASTGWDYHLSTIPELKKDVLDKVDFIVDNNIALQGNECETAGNKYEIKSPEILKQYNDIAILITVRFRYYEEICNQLISYNLGDNVTCYSLQLLYERQGSADNGCVLDYFKSHKTIQIPKKIHSFWFSGEEKPDIYKKCIESWHKFCPDYEIHEWNTNNYDINKNLYMKQAYKNRKWAFVSDYARLDVIYQYGGIYLDMDVELLNSIDKLLSASGFFCRQKDGTVDLGTGFGFAPKYALIKKLLNVYENLEFVKANKELDILPQPSRLAPVFKNIGIERSHDSQIVNDIIVLSDEYIKCGDDDLDSASFSADVLGIHWHNGGWLKGDEKNNRLIDVQVKKQFVDALFEKSNQNK